MHYTSRPARRAILEGPHIGNDGKRNGGRRICPSATVSTYHFRKFATSAPTAHQTLPVFARGGHVTNDEVTGLARGQATHPFGE